MSQTIQQIKCLVWDLDNTIWHGTLLEDKQVKLNPQAVEIVRELDRRGILQSISSKNNHDEAMEKLKSFGLDEYFLYPQINWQPKSTSINQIATSLNIGIDTFAFIDDQQFELDEVNFSLPKVSTIRVENINSILNDPAFLPRFITEDSKIRRKMYQSDIERNKVEESFKGPKEEFLRTLNMRLTIALATEDDLQRAEELTLRTHQLNTTGYTYSYDQLNAFRVSPSHSLIILSLEDNYGTYGKIGLVLLEKSATAWTIKLLLMSCRVMSKGIGGSIIHYLRSLAKKNGVQLLAEFVPTDRNRMMYMTYKFANFVEKHQQENFVLLENDLSFVPEIPGYLRIMQELFL